jgi:pimeloyl-ACP methyl ester carboxylesterase
MFFFQLPGIPEALFRVVGRRTLTDTSRPGTFTPEDLDRYSESWGQPGCVTGMINWYRALLRVRPPSLADPIVHVPTTIIWGKQDRFLRHEMAAESTRLCSQGRLLYLDDATHWVQHEEPDRVNAVLIG